MNSQRILFVVIALAALAVGIGFSNGRLQPGAANPEAVPMLFAQRYRDTSGTEQPLSDWRGKFLVVNFWATWCPPCVQEMPHLQQVRDEFVDHNVEILGLGVDSADNIARFQQQYGIRFPLYTAGASGADLAQAFGNAARVLPYTVLITPEGTVTQRKVGQISPEELRDWLIARNTARNPRP